MEVELLQALGKIAGIGGLALGVFVLLFQEVIRKNIFPMLSDDHAYGLIRQLMFLTFAVAVCGIGAWTYVSIKSTPVVSTVSASTHDVEESTARPVDVTGTWKASVKYNWGDTYPETFDFEVHGQDLAGSASYVTAPHGIVEGKIDGNRLSFLTTSYSELNDQRYQEKHRYRGTVLGDTIEFVLDTDSGYDAPPPAKFTAHRVATK